MAEQRKLEIRELQLNQVYFYWMNQQPGMNPYETIKLMELVKKIKEDFQLTIFLIEHHMQFVMGICERIMVMDFEESRLQRGLLRKYKKTRK